MQMRRTHATHRPVRPRAPRRALGLALVLALSLAACGGGDGDGADPTPSASAAPGSEGALELAASVASFDLSTGTDQRLIVGVTTTEREVIGGGTLEFRIAPLGEEPAASGEVQLGDPVTATFLPVPGNGPEDLGDTPGIIEGRGVGVYEATVDLPEPGFYGLRVTGEVDGTPVSADASFQVLDEPQVVSVGEPAPATEGPLAGDEGVDPVTIDSRAQGGEPVPDPELHDVTVADALAAGRPIVVLVSTPVYCVSQFCGPITETVADLATEYEDVAEFVHLEVWQDFEEQQLNEAAAQWIQTEAGGNEPWLFLVGADGNVQARWDNVLDEAALVEALDAL